MIRAEARLFERLKFSLFAITIAAHPGVGLWGRDVLGGYDWIMQVGVRRMLASF